MNIYWLEDGEIDEFGISNEIIVDLIYCGLILFYFEVFLNMNCGICGSCYSIG